MTEIYDVVIIGGGPGGYEAAAEAASRYGMKTALVEKDSLGGTCLNRGCVPTKTWMYSAEVYDDFRRKGPSIGMTGCSDADVDVSVIRERKEQVREQLVSGVALMMKKSRVDVYNGFGCILDPKYVEVSPVDGIPVRRAAGKNGGEWEAVAEDPEETLLLETKKIIIATGSEAALPPIPGIDTEGVITSRELLDFTELPESLIILGGGVIGLEFATIYAALGCRVTIVEALDRILPKIDKDISQAMRQTLKKQGVEIHTRAAITEVRRDSEQGGVICSFTEKGETQEIRADYMLAAAGRKPDLEGLFRRSGDGQTDSFIPETDKGYIKVDERFRTNVPEIYAIGDSIGGVQLAHMATAEGRAVMAAMHGDPIPVDLSVVPTCIYTRPEIATVGIGADEAKAQGLSVVTKKLPMGGNAKAVIAMEDRGTIKIIEDAETHRILGAQLMCPRATDMISEFAQAMVNDMTVEEMARTIHPHPTFSEAISNALQLFEE